LEKVTTSSNEESATRPESEPEDVEGTNVSGCAPTSGSAAEEVEQAMAAASKTSKGSSQKAPPKTANAPPGVPSILNWELIEDGTFFVVVGVIDRTIFQWRIELTLSDAFASFQVGFRV
jgi:hypothetical protein